MNLSWPAALGATRYEFSMQIRRKSLWIAMIAAILFLFGWNRQLWPFPYDTSWARTAGNWALSCNRFLPVIFGVLLADRLQRDRRLNVEELLDSTGAPAGSQLIGKYAGSTLATATPIFLFYITGVADMLVRLHNPMVIPYALAAFAVIILPGLLFVAAFSIAVPVVLWVPLYQFLFVGYWFWGNLLTPRFRIPTLSDTFLTPFGGTAAVGFFNTHPIFNHVLLSDMSAGWQGAISVAALLACAAAALFTAHAYLAWQRARA